MNPLRVFQMPKLKTFEITSVFQEKGARDVSKRFWYTKKQVINNKMPKLLNLALEKNMNFIFIKSQLSQGEKLPLRIASYWIYLPAAFSIMWLAICSHQGDKSLYYLQNAILLAISVWVCIEAYRKRMEIFLIEKKSGLLAVLAAVVTASLHKPVIDMSLALNWYNATLKLSTFFSAQPVGKALWENIFIFCGMTAVFTLFFIFFYCFYKGMGIYLKKWREDFSRIEMICLAAVGIIFSAFIVFVYMKTSAFSYTAIARDLIYSSDTGSLYPLNAYMIMFSPENDIKQPLFALFSAPLCVFPYFISKIIFFIPDLYAYLLAILQMFMLLFSFLTLSKLLIPDNKEERILFFILLSSSFPAFLFILNLEQYISALFWIMIFIHSLLQNKMPQRWISFAFLAAAGSLTTNWLLIVLFFKRHKIAAGIKRSALLVLMYFILCNIYFVFFTVKYSCQSCIVLLSQYSSLLDPASSASGYCSFYGRCCQFSNFIYSCIFAPVSTVMLNSFYSICNFPFYTYQLVPCSTIHP